MNDRRVLAAFLALLGASLFILTEVWDITAQSYWLSGGILLVVFLQVALYWHLVGRRINSKSLNILGWVWIFCIVFGSRLGGRMGCDERFLRLADVFLFGVALAVSCAEIRKWINQGRKAKYEGTEPSN